MVGILAAAPCVASCSHLGRAPRAQLQGTHAWMEGPLMPPDAAASPWITHPAALAVIASKPLAPAPLPCPQKGRRGHMQLWIQSGVGAQGGQTTLPAAAAGPNCTTQVTAPARR